MVTKVEGGNNIKVTYNKKTRKLPKRYIPTSLSKSDRKKQIKSIFNGTKRPKLSYKSKKSSWTQKFDSVYGDKIKKLSGGHTLINISIVSKIPLEAINEVFRKGKAAYYVSGSRPNQTAESWAYARVYSYIMGGNTRKIDNHITIKFNVKFKH